MPLQTIEGNILDITEGVICHQVNCRGVMGAGIAKSIANKYPDVLYEYKAHVAKTRSECLGYCQVVGTEGPWVANIFGQVGYGRQGRFTNYGAVANAFMELAFAFEERDWPIYVPYQMGCGLAGASWEIYSEIIEFNVPDAIIVRLPS